MQILNPNEIENQSFKIIQSKIDTLNYSGSLENLEVIKRVIHATADFDFLKNLYFSEPVGSPLSGNVISNTREILKNGATIITDTLMLKSGINKSVADSLVAANALAYFVYIRPDSFANIGNLVNERNFCCQHRVCRILC